MPEIKVEKHDTCYVSYLQGINGIIVGEGTTYEEAVSDAVSAIKFHISVFGMDSMNMGTNDEEKSV
ncbi:MAG: hypothetical protein JXN62_04235 [Bacteroidales bacterium]|nr:hypothetical protein [Bacteroidales bacterium]